MNVDIKADITGVCVPFVGAVERVGVEWRLSLAVSVLGSDLVRVLVKFKVMSGSEMAAGDVPVVVVAEEAFDFPDFVWFLCSHTCGLVSGLDK